MTQPGLTRLASYGVAVDDDERILLCRLSIDELDVGQWTLPGGGVEFGEDPAVAAVREIEEETGLTVRLRGVLGIDSRVYPPRERRSTPLHAIRIVYDVDVDLDTGELRHEVGGSTDQARWFSRAEIDGLPVVDLVEAALAMLDRRAG
ncbi:MAG: 8-oxo-dGTP diphosphatase [Chloroflexota bacterium]|nr:8-oxo-dGTP diphosphatase [Chloroflexota bacterium]